MLRKYHLTSALSACILGSVTLSATEADHQQRSRHYIAKSDKQYNATSGFIEEDAVPGYTWASEKAYEAFQDMKYGVRIHWGIYSLYGQMQETWPFLKFSAVEKHAYNEKYKTWNPVGFNADAWMDLFAESGMKMFAFTTKHHDGFSLYDTKTRVKRRVNYLAPGGPQIEECDLAYSIMETPFKRDVVKELCDAARKHDIKIDLYFSNNDWYDADFRPYVWHPLQVPSSPTLAVLRRKGPDNEPEAKFDERFGPVGGPFIVPDPTPEEVNRMMARHRDQLKELLTRYGKIDMICLDMWLGPSVWPQFRQTMLDLRKIQPDVMFRARGIGNYGDYYTPEGFVPGSKENTQVPWFVIYPLGKYFSYEPDAANHKGSKWIVDNLVDSAAKGGNFMVGIGPSGDGTFHPTAIEQLRAVGRWLKKNGVAIYATRAREGDLWHEGDTVRFTRSKDNKTVYAHSLVWPGEKLTLKTVRVRPGGKVIFLGQPAAKVQWEQAADGTLTIEMKEELRAGLSPDEQLAFSFAIDV
jgi:alpha-L-fucosidase